MIHCIFTLDYEIYGDGHGSLEDLVYRPAERLRNLFLTRNVRFVTFVEVAELEQIDRAQSDPAIQLVKHQVRQLHEDGFETGLHLHPQWYNASYTQGRWSLDYSEYSLCALPRSRVAEIVGRSIQYLRHLVGDPAFAPLSFRAGNWLLQPTQPAAGVLAENGLRVDSSVFKGGLQRQHGLDFRRALRNGHYWRFESDVNEPDSGGILMELPIHVEMVPFWHMLTSKRLAVHKRSNSPQQRGGTGVGRLRDYLRLRYPLKLDFCRMTFRELSAMLDRVIQEDRRDPERLRPVVAIGHTKDLVDTDTVDAFLSYLAAKSIPVSTLAGLYPRLERHRSAEVT